MTTELAVQTKPITLEVYVSETKKKYPAELKNKPKVL